METNESTTISTVEPSQATIEQGAAFIGGVFSNVALGRHILTVNTARSVENVCFSKDWDSSIVIDDSNHRVLFETVLVALELDKVLGVTLRSTGGAANPSAPTETRGWVITPFSIRALTAEEAIEACCGTNSHGEPNQPEPGVAYKGGWAIPSASKK